MSGHGRATATSLAPRRRGLRRTRRSAHPLGALRQRRAGGALPALLVDRPLAGLEDAGSRTSRATSASSPSTRAGTAGPTARTRQPPTTRRSSPPTPWPCSTRPAPTRRRSSGSRWAGSTRSTWPRRASRPGRRRACSSTPRFRSLAAGGGRVDVRGRLETTRAGTSTMRTTGAATTAASSSSSSPRSSASRTRRSRSRTASAGASRRPQRPWSRPSWAGHPGREAALELCAQRPLPGAGHPRHRRPGRSRTRAALRSRKRRRPTGHARGLGPLPAGPRPGQGQPADRRVPRCAGTDRPSGALPARRRARTRARCSSQPDRPRPRPA